MMWQNIIDKYYPAGTPLRDILISHSRKVAEKALAINSRLNLGLDPAMVEGCAMTHDIGIFLTNAPAIECHGTEPYIRHGILGAELLRKENAPDEWAGVAMNHTGSGLTAEDIAAQNLPLPPGDYLPRTQLEKLICYADKFFSKSGDGGEKDIARVRKQMARHGAAAAGRFEELHRQFFL